VEPERLKAILESLLLAAGEPVPAGKLAAACEDAPLDAVKGALDELAREFADAHRGIVIEQIAGGYQLRTSLENAPYVRRLLATRQTRLSRPLLETLAIVAYRQPVTRAEIEQVRGVDCGGVLETLLGRRLVRIAGRKAVPGRPMLYATTADFLGTFGLKSLKALPQIDGIEALAGQTSPEMMIEEAMEGPAGDERLGDEHLGSEQLDTEKPPAGEQAGSDTCGAAIEAVAAAQSAQASAAETSGAAANPRQEPGAAEPVGDVPDVVESSTDPGCATGSGRGLSAERN
jgi:segregation and condensation protein B